MRKFLQFFFHHFYHSFAWTYDFVAAVVSVGRWKEWGVAALPYLRGAHILELGFGPGHLQVELNQQGFRTFGLDESRQMLRRAQANLRRKRLPAALSRGYAHSLPFKAGSFDSVVAAFPTEYITDQLTLAEIRRVLKPNGRLVITPTAWIWGKSLPDRGANWLFRITNQGEALTDTLEARIKSVFGKTGFRVEVMYTDIHQSTVLVIIAEINQGV